MVLIVETTSQILDDEAAAISIELDLVVLKDPRHHVAAKGAVEGAVGGRGDAVLVARHEAVGFDRSRPISKSRAELHEGLVGQGTVGDKDFWPHAEGEVKDRAKTLVKFPEERREFENGLSKP